MLDDSELERDIARYLEGSCGKSTTQSAKAKWTRYYLESKSPLSGLSVARISTKQEMERHHNVSNIDADIKWYREVSKQPNETWCDLMVWHREHVSFTRTGHYCSYADLAVWVYGNANAARAISNAYKGLNYFFLDHHRERHWVNDAIRTGGSSFDRNDFYDMRRQRAAGYDDADETTPWLKFTTKRGGIAQIEQRPRFKHRKRSRSAPVGGDVAPEDDDDVTPPEEDDDDDRTIPLPDDHQNDQLEKPKSSSSPPPNDEMHPQVRALLAQCHLQTREADFVAQGAVTLDLLRFTDEAHLDSMKIPELKKRKLLHLLASPSSSTMGNAAS